MASTRIMPRGPLLPDKAKSPIERSSRLIAAIGLFGLTILALVTMIDIAGRELFKTPISGFSDIADFIVVFSAAACFPISLVERHHVAVRFLGQLHWRLREAFDLLGHSLLLVVFVAICWQLFVYSLEMVRSGQTTWLMGIPVWPLWVATTLVIGACVPVQAVILLEQAKRALSPVPVPDRNTQSSMDAISEPGDLDGPH